MTIYDQFPAGSPPSLSPPTSAPIHIHTRKHQYDDSDLSPVSSFEDGVDDFDGPLWWNATDADSTAAEAGLQSYQAFLREQLSPKEGGGYRHGSLPVKRAKKEERGDKAMCSKMEKEGKKDHTRIVEEMSRSHDDAGKVEFCFWSMNGCTCQCGKCN